MSRKRFILDDEGPPPRVRQRQLPWLSIAVVVMLLGLIGSIIYTSVQLNKLAGEETGALVTTYCNACSNQQVQRVAAIADARCDLCRKPVGYARKCLACKKLFGYVPPPPASLPAAAREASGSKLDHLQAFSPPIICPSCGSANTVPVNGPKPSASTRKSAE